VIVLDVNVLVAAATEQHIHHAPAERFMNGELASWSPVIVPDVAWSGFARVMTNPAATKPPLDWGGVMSFVDGVMGQPGYAHHSRGLSTDLHRFFDLCRSVEARGNLVSDAYLAAIAIANHCPLASFDRDFTRFPGLKLLIPGDPATLAR